MSSVGDKLTTVDDLKAAYDDVDGKLLNNDFSVYTIATTPYNNNTLIPLRLGNDNLVTDFGTLSTQLGGGGGTNQGALVHYTAQYGPFGTSGQSSTLNTTVNDSNVTADMCVLKAVFSNPSAQTSDWTITCSHNGTTGQVNFQGGITGVTNVTLYFGVAMTAAPSLLVNLGSNNSDNILKASVSPGVTGVLGLSNGGTGASTAAGALTALGAVPKTDLTSIIATGTTNATGATIAKGMYFYLNGALVRAKEPISSGAMFTSGTNYEAVTAGGLNALYNDLKFVFGSVDFENGDYAKTAYMGGKFASSIDNVQLTPSANEVTVSCAIVNSNTVTIGRRPATTPCTVYYMVHGT